MACELEILLIRPSAAGGPCQSDSGKFQQEDSDNVMPVIMVDLFSGSVRLAEYHPSALSPLLKL